MAHLVKSFFVYILVFIAFTACTKVVDSGSSTTTGKTYLSLTVADSLLPYKGFVVTPNDGSLITTLGYFNSVGYFNFVSGTTDIKIQSPISGSVFFDTVVNLAAGSINTAFAYSYGNIAKATIVQDDYSSPAAGKAKVRLLNLWTALSSGTANFTISDGANTFNFSKRYFLDHEKDHSLENFISIPASNYTIYATVGTSLIINPFSFNLLNGKIYTIAVTDVRGGQLISPVIAHN